ncbi:hypothetical protein Landi51_05835 [Colletotrichum acutatum]
MLNEVSAPRSTGRQPHRDSSESRQGPSQPPQPPLVTDVQNQLAPFAQQLADAAPGRELPWAILLAAAAPSSPLGFCRLNDPRPFA